jgi:hypothetical protein
MLVSFAMLKYFVMGIKELLKKKCKVCGIVIPYAWKTCQKHSGYIRKTVPKLTRYTMEDYADVLKVFKVHPSLSRVNLIDREYLIIDEKGVVVGYK